MKGVKIMNRQDFIASLRKELSKLPPEEIADATEFYEEYFDEVLEKLDVEGLTDEEAEAKRSKAEAELIEEMGSPKSCANQIKAEYASKILEGTDKGTASGSKPSVGNKISAVWWIIIGICTAPVSIPVLIGLIGMVCGIVTGLLGLIAGLFTGIIAAFIASIVCFFFGISNLAVSVPAAIMLIGIGLMGAALSAAAMVGAVLVVKEIVLALVHFGTELNEKRKMKKFEKLQKGGEEA